MKILYFIALYSKDIPEIHLNSGSSKMALPFKYMHTCRNKSNGRDELKLIWMPKNSSRLSAFFDGGHGGRQESDRFCFPCKISAWRARKREKGRRDRASSRVSRELTRLRISRRTARNLRRPAGRLAATAEIAN